MVSHASNTTLLLNVMLAGLLLASSGCDNDDAPPLAVTAAAASGLTPGNGAIGVPLNQPVSATFPASMNASTLNSTSFTLTGPGGTAVAGTVTYDAPNRMARLTPVSNLAASTVYTARLTTAVRDSADRPLPADEVWTFTTGVRVGLGPLAVSSTDPANGETGAATNHSVAAVFRSPMDGTTITNSTFTVRTGGTFDTGTVVYNVASRVATFTPADLLQSGSTFIAQLSTAVKDATGNPLASPYVWGFSTGSAADTTAPTVTSTVPADRTTGVALNQKVHATFSKSMNPATLTSATFTVSGPGAAALTGTVTYDAPSRIATFSPSDLLSPSSTYTPTISAGARDLAGNALAASVVWTFSTSATAVTTQPEVIPLGTAGRFAILAGSTVTNDGPTLIHGDLGLSPGTAVEGFPPGFVDGEIHAGDSAAAEAKLDLTRAYNDAAGRSTAPISVSGNLGGQTLAPGLYKTGSSLAVSEGDLTLDAKGDANGAFIFQMGSTLTTTVDRKVILAGGAKATNIYWQVGTSATIGVRSVFQGNILADQSITMNTGATLDGRVLTRIGAVVLNANVVTVPGQ